MSSTNNVDDDDDGGTRCDEASAESVQSNPPPVNKRTNRDWPANPFRIWKFIAGVYPGVTVNAAKAMDADMSEKEEGGRGSLIGNLRPMQ
ncbi:hypothetical protein ZHAS_00008309 [Anopheles sinensis]|uniref:Uncharacterized protein n=1 Tax=Anopheles sinensis TaxID=74873 RepID=A0A084VRU6_ANOSI|nr:hypothetical protein ZHAS_00008309 [Anopheles sinensis]